MVTLVCHRVSSSGDDSKLIVWQVAGSNTSALRTFSHRDWCRRGIFSLDGSTILSCCDDKKLRVFSLSSSASEPVKTFNTHHADWLLCADWYPRAGSVRDAWSRCYFCPCHSYLSPSGVWCAPM